MKTLTFGFVFAAAALAGPFSPLNYGSALAGCEGTQGYDEQQHDSGIVASAYCESPEYLGGFAFASAFVQAGNGAIQVAISNLHAHPFHTSVQAYSTVFATLQLPVGQLVIVDFDVRWSAWCGNNSVHFESRASFGSPHGGGYAEICNNSLPEGWVGGFASFSSPEFIVSPELTEYVAIARHSLNVLETEYGLYDGSVEIAGLSFQAVPEPSTLVLVGVGLVALGLIRRKPGKRS